jgi:hypothetical protein
VSDGTRLRDAFLLDPGVTFLNHGSFGAAPRAVFGRRPRGQAAGARYVRTPIRLPVESSEEMVETIWAGVGPRTKVLYLSHHTSSTALTVPVAELCRRARERGLPHGRRRRTSGLKG